MASDDPVGWGNFNECGNFVLWADQPPADWLPPGSRRAARAAGTTAPTLGVATAGATTTPAATIVKTAYNGLSSANTRDEQRRINMLNLEPPEAPYLGHNLFDTSARTKDAATQTTATLADCIRRFPSPRSGERLKKQ